ncbi:uncharacterized protein LOC128960725 [Oppia nitens]|uniref:uncharacterized protein LOC128960725 n=1 Tax=Oppia nitens TaxID=1686743 RepID=UPI0023DA7BD2|nr:uncharacterized protein LOC128960725 [Oppia nitens]
MGEKSFTYKTIKYLLITKICIGIVFSFILLFLFVVMTAHNSTDGRTQGISAQDTLLYDHPDAKTMDKSMMGIVVAFITLEIIIQIIGLVGVVRANIILLLIFGILISLGALFEFVAIFTHDGNALFLIYFTFLSVLVFVYIYLVRTERQQLPRVHYIPAPTNPYHYSYFPQPNTNNNQRLLFKDNVDI